MLCRVAREQLHKIAGGDALRGLGAYAALGVHVLRCAPCRQELRRLRRLNELSRTLPVPTLPSNMRAQVLAELPVPMSVPSARKGVTIMRLSLIGGTCLTLAFIAGFLLLPRHRPALAGSDVRTALANARSWHLGGWKMEGDRRVAWEVWGQRSPFFYRERIGEQEVMDDGVNRYLVIPPYPNQKTGMSLKTASTVDINNIGMKFPGLRDMTGVNQVWKRIGDETTYSIAEMWTASDHPLRRNDLYTFEGDRPLPRVYSVHQRQYGEHSRTDQFDTDKIAKGAVEKEMDRAEYYVQRALQVPKQDQSTPESKALFSQAVRWQKRQIESVRPIWKTMAQDNLKSVQAAWSKSDTHNP